jgi:hypothetical protein
MFKKLQNTQKLLFAVVFALVFTACSKNNDVEPEDTKEFKFINLLVSDENTKQVSLVMPRDGSVKTFEAKFAKSALYTTKSGRFGVLVHRVNNYVEKFDTGFENHGDHTDVKGTPKFGAMVGEGKLPTHFKSYGSEIAIFNDGDGTLDIGNENDFHNVGAKMKRVNTGNVAHHGAMAKFDNGNYAVTEKDGSVAGTLPERVKIMDTNGKLIAASTVQTKGIHGNATNGKNAVFGSASGVLVVGADGKQKLINHPADFGTVWFGTILEAKSAGKFIGYTGAKGAYFIDIVADKVTPIIENTDIMQCKVDYAGENLIVLLHSGEVNIFDLKTGLLKTKANIISKIEKTETQKPQIEATQKYLYVVMPKLGEVHQIETKNLANITKIKVSGTPYRIAIMGMETSKGHDD